MTIHPMNVFPWIFAQFKDAKRVFGKFNKYLMKGKRLSLNIPSNKIQNFNIEKNQNFSENILLNLSNVEIKYNNYQKENNSKDIYHEYKISEKKKEDKEKNKTLSDFSLYIDNENKLTIEKNQITIIYGNNASGKSLLLKSIIDYISKEDKFSETLIINSENNKNLNISRDDLNNNHIYFKNDKISYVPQELWTFSASIFENITFSNKKNLANKNSENFDKKFHEIIEKCELIKDINTFNDKENKIISFKGSNISGGQMQRINIARAAFNDSELILLDNCLSSIDSNIANLIFLNLFQSLKKESKGILFVTSDTKWLGKGDKVYFIENNKLILKKKFELENLINPNKSENMKKENSIEIIDSEKIEDLVIEKILDKEKNFESEKKNEENSNEKISISLQTFIFYFSKAGYGLFFLTILCLILMQLGRNYIELFLADWLKNDKLNQDKKFEIQIINMKYYLLFVIMHTIVTIGRSAFFGINFLRGCEKIYKLTIEKFIFSKIKSLQKFNISFLTNL